MKEKEVEEVAASGIFKGKPLAGKVEETHISWVILSEKYAFKLKKPIALSFLDYSSLALRKKFCEKELELNRRYTDIYLDVLPICKSNGHWIIGAGEGEVYDYAVQMKKMATDKQMDNLLKEDKVTQKNITSLAGVVSEFHRQATIIKEPFDLEKSRNLFNDIEQVRDIVKDNLGDDLEKIIPEAMAWGNHILETFADRLQERIDEGFRRDLHGDLHSGNIFLNDNPVLFDCIEFNDTYRQIDVLYEIAFLCMDLEAFGQNGLANQFLEDYNRLFKVLIKEEDKSLFHYFKCLRANIRAKVHALSVKNSADAISKSEHLAETEKYLRLIKNYISG